LVYIYIYIYEIPAHGGARLYLKFNKNNEQGMELSYSESDMVQSAAQ